MEDPWEVVVVSSNPRIHHHVAGMLFRLGIDRICVSSVNELREIPRRDNIRLVFCDRQMKDGDYHDVLSAVPPTSKVVMMSEVESPEEYQRAKHFGLFDVIPTPCRAADIEWMVIQARRQKQPILHRTARVGA
jgi:DNA-binding NtrC family response regulator